MFLCDPIVSVSLILPQFPIVLHLVAILISSTHKRSSLFFTFFFIKLFKTVCFFYSYLNFVVVSLPYYTRFYCFRYHFSFFSLTFCFVPHFLQRLVQLILFYFSYSPLSDHRHPYNIFVSRIRFQSHPPRALCLLI